MSQIKADDYNIRFPGNGMMLLGQMEEIPVGGEVWDCKHSCALQAVYDHFRFGMHPHLEKYRAFFREDPDINGEPEREQELIQGCIDEA